MVLKKFWRRRTPIQLYIETHMQRLYTVSVITGEKGGGIRDLAELIFWLVLAPKHLQWWQQVGFLRTHQVTGTTHNTWTGLIYSVSSATLGGELSVSTLPLHHNKEWWAKSALSIPHEMITNKVRNATLLSDVGKGKGQANYQRKASVNLWVKRVFLVGFFLFLFKLSKHSCSFVFKVSCKAQKIQDYVTGL